MSRYHWTAIYAAMFLAGFLATFGDARAAGVIRKYITPIVAPVTNTPPAPPVVTNQPPPVVPVPPAVAIDEVPFAELKWTAGGFNGSRAAHDPNVEIAALRATPTKLSYRWVRGLSAWGLADTDAGAVCAVFFRDANDRWAGGKFDWISTSRSSRGLENILNEGKYRRDLSVFPSPCGCAFVVVSADGRKRSNVIAATYRRP